jgi:hypothetical protein
MTPNDQPPPPRRFAPHGKPPEQGAVSIDEIVKGFNDHVAPKLAEKFTYILQNHGSFYFCAQPSPVAMEENLEDMSINLAQPQNIRDASIIAFGGAPHADMKILEVAQAAFLLVEGLKGRLSPPGSNPDIDISSPALNGIAVFNPDICHIPMPQDLQEADFHQGRRYKDWAIKRNKEQAAQQAQADALQRLQESVKEVYEWNKDKTFISPAARKAAEELFKHRFLEQVNDVQERILPPEERKLLPPEEVKPCCVFTYSMGSRFSFMVENALIEMLRARQVPDEQIQQYFDRMPRISIGSAPDVEDLGADRPTAPTNHIFAQNDRGAAVPQAFAPYVDATNPNPLTGLRTLTDEQVKNGGNDNTPETPPVNARFIPLSVAHFPKSRNQNVIVLSSAMVPEAAYEAHNERFHSLLPYIGAICGTEVIVPNLDPATMAEGPWKRDPKTPGLDKAMLQHLADCIPGLTASLEQTAAAEQEAPPPVTTPRQIMPDQGTQKERTDS